MTFFVNSWAHMFGNQPYSLDNSARDCWWVAYVTNGEGYHNFHHRFPSDYRNGIRWYQWDPTKWWLWALNRAGFAQRLTRTPDFTILRTRVDVEASRAEKNLRAISESLWNGMKDQLQASRARLSFLLTEYAQAKNRYREMKKTASSEMTIYWHQKTQEYKEQLKLARAHWHRVLYTLQKSPAATT